MAIANPIFALPKAVLAIAKAAFERKFSILGGLIAQSADAKAVFTGSEIENHFAKTAFAEEFSMLEPLIAASTNCKTASANSMMGWRSHF